MTQEEWKEKNDFNYDHLNKYKEYIKPTLERAIADKNWAKLNQNAVFFAMETAGLISIAEFGNEEAKKIAMQRLENWYFTGKGRGGRSKIKAAYSWGETINKFILKTQEKSKPIQGELF
jgi:hypothetical protein